MVKLKGQLFKVGGSYALLVPKAIVANDILKTETLYEFEVKEAKGHKTTLQKEEALNSENKPATNVGPDLSLVRASVKELAFSGSKEDYMSGKVPIPVSQESWAEQWMLGYPNRNLNTKVNTR